MQKEDQRVVKEMIEGVLSDYPGVSTENARDELVTDGSPAKAKEDENENEKGKSPIKGQWETKQSEEERQVKRMMMLMRKAREAEEEAERRARVEKAVVEEVEKKLRKTQLKLRRLRKTSLYTQGRESDGAEDDEDDEDDGADSDHLPENDDSGVSGSDDTSPLETPTKRTTKTRARISTKSTAKTKIRTLTPPVAMAGLDRIRELEMERVQNDLAKQEEEARHLEGLLQEANEKMGGMNGRVSY